MSEEAEHQDRIWSDVFGQIPFETNCVKMCTV